MSEPCLDLSVFEELDADFDCPEWIKDIMPGMKEDDPFDLDLAAGAPPPAPAAGPIVGRLFDFKTVAMTSVLPRALPEPDQPTPAADLSLAGMIKWFHENDGRLKHSRPAAHAAFWRIPGKSRPLGKNKRRDKKLHNLLLQVWKEHRLWGV